TGPSGPSDRDFTRLEGWVRDPDDPTWGSAGYFEMVFGDEMYGGAGDIISAGQATGKVFLAGSDGGDIIGGAAGLNTPLESEIYGGDGNDWLSGGTGESIIYGGGGENYIVGGGGTSEIYGGDERDHIWGGNAPDLIWGEGGDDDIWGGGGGDTIYGGNNN